MVKAELIKRSPLRVFEKSINGGVGKGKIGVIASKKALEKQPALFTLRRINCSETAM